MLFTAFQIDTIKKLKHRIVVKGEKWVGAKWLSTELINCYVLRKLGLLRYRNKSLFQETLHAKNSMSQVHFKMLIKCVGIAQLHKISIAPP